LTKWKLIPAFLIFGEDVADVGQPELIGKVPGKGGVFKATIGLMKQYGHLRVYNSQLAERRFVGTATGMATRGLKPVAEIQFGDYIWPGFMQLMNETAKIRWRSFNNFSCPAIISSRGRRVPRGLGCALSLPVD